MLSYPNGVPYFYLEDGIDLLKVYDGTTLMDTLTGTNPDNLPNLYTLGPEMKFEFTR